MYHSISLDNSVAHNGHLFHLGVSICDNEYYIRHFKPNFRPKGYSRND